MITLNPLSKMTIRGIPIQFGESYLNSLAARDLVIISDMDLTASVRVQGTRNVVAELAARNIPISVDLSGITEAGTFELPVTVSLPLPFPFHDISIVTLDPLTIYVEVDRIIEQNVILRVETSGELPEGFTFDGAVIEPQSIVVRGAASIIRDIASATVTIPLGGQTDDFEVEGLDIVFASRSGETIPIEQLEFDVDELSVAASVSILAYRTVPIIPTLGEEFEHLIDIGTYILSVMPYEVVIFGSPSVIAEVEEITTTLAVLVAESGEVGNNDEDEFDGVRLTATLELPDDVSVWSEALDEIEILLERIGGGNNNG